MRTTESCRGAEEPSQKQRVAVGAQRIVDTRWFVNAANSSGRTACPRRNHPVLSHFRLLTRVFPWRVKARIGAGNYVRSRRPVF
jgi:hypothetical protein